MRFLPVFPALLCGCAVLAAGSHRTTWELSNFTWVKLVKVEKGAGPVEHPAVLDADALRSGLAAIQWNGEGLFEAKELDRLLKPLLEAFAGATPGEDLVLLSTNRRGTGFMGTPYGLTARLFVQGGQVNIIVHDARLEFVGRVQADDMVPRFTYGSRTEASEIVLAAKGLVSRRADWVAFPAVPAAAPTAAPQPAAKAPAAPGETAAARLRNLKELRDQNLVTEEEYQKKRKEILEGL